MDTMYKMCMVGRAVTIFTRLLAQNAKKLLQLFLNVCHLHVSSTPQLQDILPDPWPIYENDYSMENLSTFPIPISANDQMISIPKIWDSLKITSWNQPILPQKIPTRWCPPSYKLLYKPCQLVRYTQNPQKIGVMFTNSTNYWLIYNSAKLE